jgi:transposase-like protein
MSVEDKGKSVESSPTAGKKKKPRFLSPEKKCQIFREAQRGEAPVAELLRPEGLYPTDLARIQRKIKESALQALAKRPGRSKKTVSEEEYRC